MQYHCQFCGTPFTPGRSDQRFCNATCRGKAGKARARGTFGRPGKEASVTPLPTVYQGEVLEGRVLPSDPMEMGEVERLTRRDLEAAEKIDTPLGAACVALARRLDNPKGDTGSAMSSVAARLDEMLTRATRGALAAGPAAAYEDELTARRNGRGA